MKLFKFTGSGGEYNIEIRNKTIFNLALKFIDELYLSIRKWREMEEFLRNQPNGTIIYNDANTCALCLEFFWCLGCPVYYKTDRQNCNGTPWKAKAKLSDTTAERIFLEDLKLELEIENEKKT